MNAVNFGNLAAVKLLLEAGAKLDVRNKEGETALDIATEQGREVIIRSLKKAIDEKKVTEDLSERLQRQQLNDVGEDGLLSFLQADLEEKEACARAMKAEKERMEEKLTCQVCMDAEVAIAFTPCGHVCCCQACTRNQALVECPNCRGRISSGMRIYLN